MPFKTTYFDTRQQAFFCFKHTDSQDRQNGHYFVANEQDYKTLYLSMGNKGIDISLEIVSE